MSNWIKITKTLNDDDLAKFLHHSWDKESQKYAETVKIPKEALDMIENRGVAMDFGVGMGRNFFYWKSMFENVIGFDTPPMIKRCGKGPIGKNVSAPDALIWDWDEIKKMSFDVVTETTCMQHVHPAEVKDRLRDIADVSPYFFSSTRSYNDYNQKNMASLVHSVRRFEPVWCDKDFELMKELKDETHYRVLYKSIR